MAGFSAAGLDVPWLSCFGNHEALNQGVGVVTPGIATALVGRRKPLTLPDRFDQEQALELFTSHPEVFMAGPARMVAADPGRRPVTRREFVEAHFRTAARPAGHGFSEQNRLDGTAYYAYDTPAARLIALDTNCLAGRGGRLPGPRSRRSGWKPGWPRCTRPTGTRPGEEVRTSHEDRLVILFSHHGHRHAHQHPGRAPRAGRRAAARRRGGARPAAPVPQRRAVAERAHAHQRGAGPPRLHRPGPRLLGGHHLLPSSTGRARPGWSS